MLRTLGQATVEYIFILFIAISVSLAVINKFTNFFKDQMGSIGHVLSTHLVVGVCPEDCFFAGYKNGFGN